MDVEESLEDTILPGTDYLQASCLSRSSDCGVIQFAKVVFEMKSPDSLNSFSICNLLSILFGLSGSLSSVS